MLQTIANWAGGNYTLSLDAAQSANQAGSAEDFEVLVNGNVVSIFKPSSTTYQLFTTVKFPVLTGTHIIEIQGLNTAGRRQHGLTSTTSRSPRRNFARTWEADHRRPSPDWMDRRALRGGAALQRGAAPSSILSAAGGEVSPDLDPTGGPGDFEAVNSIGLAEPEMHPAIGGGEVAAAPGEGPDDRPTADRRPDLRPDGLGRGRLAADQFEGQRTPPGRDVPEQGGRGRPGR